MTDKAMTLLRRRVNETSGRVDCVEDETHARIDELAEQLRTLQQRVTDLDRRARLSDEHITDIGRIACAASGEAAQAGQDVAALKGGGVVQRASATIFCPGCDGRGGEDQGANGIPEWGECELCNGKGSWTSQEFSDMLTDQLFSRIEKQQGGELREGEPCLVWRPGATIPAWACTRYDPARDVRNGGEFHYLPQPAAPGVK